MQIHRNGCRQDLYVKKINKSLSQKTTTKKNQDERIQCKYIGKTSNEM